MTDDNAVVFGKKAVEQIARAVRDNQHRMMLPRGHRGRWQFHGGSGGGHEIWFVINSVICNANGTMTLVVTPTYYTGGCHGTIPGQDSYGHVVVEDICSILSYYTATWLGHGGVIGRATYMYPRTGYCVPVWLVDQICGQPTCG